MTKTMTSPAEVVDAMHAAFRRGDLGAIAAHWDENVVYEAPGITVQGKAARTIAETVWLNAFSENDVQTLARYVDGDQIVDFCTMSGLHTGPLALPGGGELPATGARLSGPYAARYRILDGKVVFQQVIYDRMALLQSLGAMPQ
jgi:ketosteroid isomerase-like protein